MRTDYLVAGAALLLLAAAPSAAQRPQEGSLKIGDAAPAFTVKLLGSHRTVTAESLKGRPAVFFFGSCT